MKRIITKFYAVTLTSIYYIRIEDELPILEKIALKGESRVPLGEKLSGYPFLSIGKQLILFSPDHEEKIIERVSTKYWGWNTSLVVALFFKKREAEKCFESTDFKQCDTRWIKDTKNVLEVIGEKHPIFSICHFPALTLIKE